MASLVELEIQYQRLTAERNALGDRYEAGEKNLLPQIKDLNTRLRAIIIEIESLQAVNSSGAIVADDQLGRTQNANEVNPNGGLLTLSNGRVTLPPETTTGSNANRLKFEAVDDFGTDDQLRPYIQTQATQIGSNQISGGPVSEDAYSTTYPRVNTGSGTGTTATTAGQYGVNQGVLAGINGGQSPGVGAAGDDRGVPSSNVVTSLNAIDWSSTIDPEPNVLDQYASYTYQASLYLMDKASYQRSISTGTKNISGAKLLVQSGGAPQGTERNDFFNLDYYIDRLEIKSFVAGKAVRLSHNVKELSMTIVEPNGISFVENLNAAVQQFISGVPGKKQNFTSQIYLLVVRFYGYDEQGNLQRGGKSTATSDPNAFVEKWFPLVISKLGFRIANKAVEYDIVAKAPPYQIAASTKDGTIPYNVEFSGQTLSDILTGPAVFANATTAPAKANAITSNKKTVRRGLITALNEHQQELVSNGVIQYPNEYGVEFILDSMASATIVNPGLNKSATSMATPGTAADQKLGTKQSMDPNSQTISAVAGMQIVQFLDNLVKNSSYVRDQQTRIINANTGKESAGPGVNLKNTAWFKIGLRAEPKYDQYDEKRNDYAYKITYTIAPYKIAQLNSPYFKQPVFNGVHKSYSYWFTGKNSQVLHYEENLNSLYYIVLSNSNLGGATSSVPGAENVNELLKYSPQTASGQSTTGAEGRTLEPAANASDQLYNPSDLKECRLSIVGDPAWMQQGEAFRSLNKGDPYYFRPFLPDGTINFDSQQILFEIAFNTPRDYNLGTGLIQPSASKLNSTTQIDQVTQTPDRAQASRIYIVKECVSHFDKGKFTQELKGSLLTIYPPGKGEGRPAPQDISTTANAAAPTVSKAPAYVPPRSSVTDPTPTSSLAKGTQQILNPPTQLNDPTLSQLQSSPVYIQARRGGATPAAALEKAQAAYAAGTNNYSGTALPGIRYPGQQIVKEP
jgi:hypothetical protein